MNRIVFPRLWAGVAACFAALSILAASPARAFGELGHQVIASLAQDMLTPRTKTQIQSTLPLFEAGDSTAMLEKIAVWADEVRSLRPETRPWHFVTLQISEVSYDPAHADTPNVVTALEKQLAILGKSVSQGKSQYARYAREEALKWVVHLVGDLHQPLHVGEDQDRGGNQTLVRINRRSVNLHAVWDGALLERLNLGLDTLHNLLAREIAANPAFLTRNAAGTVRSWVNETHAKARLCYMQDGRPFPKGDKTALNEDYLRRSTLLVLNQLKIAAIRLAFLLNASLDPSGPKQPIAPSYSRAVKPMASDMAIPRGGKYAWSATSQTYHFSTCRQVSRIKRKNLRSSDIQPLGRSFHTGCPNQK